MITLAWQLSVCWIDGQGMSPNAATWSGSSAGTTWVCTSMAQQGLLMVAPSVLARRHFQPQSVERIGDLDLAAEPRGLVVMRAELQHVLLVLLLGRQALTPLGRHIDHAGGARAGAAAIGVDAGDQGADRAFHDRLAVGDVDQVLLAVGLLERDLRHPLPLGFHVLHCHALIAE